MAFGTLVSAKDRREATERYLAAPRPSVDYPIMCRCAQRPIPHYHTAAQRFFAEKIERDLREMEQL